MPQIAVRQRIHAVIVQAGVHRVGHQHRVVDRRHVDALTGKDLGVIFHVLPDLEDARILEHGLEHGEGGRGLHLPLGQRIGPEQVARGRRLVRQRDIAGLPGSDAERDADQFGPHLVERGRLGIHRDMSTLGNAVEPHLQGGGIGHAVIGGMVKGGSGSGLGRRRVGRHRLDRHGLRDTQLVRDAFGDRAELHLGQKAQQRRGVRHPHFERVEREIERRLRVKLHQLPRQADLLGVVDQGLAPLVLFDLARAGEQAVQIAEFIDEQCGRLDPDAGRAGDVVHRIARQRLHIDDPLGPDAEFFEHAVAVDHLVLHRVAHLHGPIDELHQVLVGRDDGDPPARLDRLPREGGDDVVGLVIRDLDTGHVEGPRRLTGQRKLRAQVLGQLGPVGLVKGVEVVAEGLGRMIEDHRDMGGRVTAAVARDLVPQDVAKAADGPNRQPVRLACQRWQRVIGAKDIGRPVDQVQVTAFAKLRLHDSTSSDPLAGVVT